MFLLALTFYDCCTQKANLQTIFSDIVLTIIPQGINIFNCRSDCGVSFKDIKVHQILRIVHCYNASMSIIFDHPLFFYENNLWFLFRARIVTVIYK